MTADKMTADKMTAGKKVIDKKTISAEKEANTMKYMVATIDNKLVFLHEAEWVLNSKKPIPAGKLVYHKDGNTLNNEYSNLDLVDENSEYGDLHNNKIFHEDSIDKKFIEKNFSDIYEILK